MNNLLPIKSALISVYHKEGLEPVIQQLHQQGVTLYSTGGTRSFIESAGIPVVPVESITGYPSILGGRVKTLHPAVFGGILRRDGIEQDAKDLEQYTIPTFDLVMVDLYPFANTLAEGKSKEEIIEKIDIGGVSLIRAAAKNHAHVLVVCDPTQYSDLQQVLESGAHTDENTRHRFAAAAFAHTARYDAAIASWFAGRDLFLPLGASVPLRYGENPHQKGSYLPSGEPFFQQLAGKEMSYNNYLDADAAMRLIAEFDSCTFAVIKHNNACGVATAPTDHEACRAALACDPVSAFGGVLICNRNISAETALQLKDLFFEILIAPSFDAAATELLKAKPNRILLVSAGKDFPDTQYRSVCNGLLMQDTDKALVSQNDLKMVTTKHPSLEEVHDLVFANKIVKHSRSNAIVLVRNQTLLASGVGQTSRVDALRQAIAKAESFGFSLKGAAMASDAFFPFPDCVEIAADAGITSVIQPGGSVKDRDSVEMADKKNISMVFSGIRHFRH
jgi:phosphoribosylaminoimidazolecarboxamide formyltransferase/IMP cyclohydrolase